MSSVQRLEIRGIRCFGPEEAQGIEFQKPLTVICGQNGCGKTTVIECLKYATTGVLPPNSRKGQSFVHDPKMSNLTEVKASIKLLFRTRTNQRAFVGKNLRLVQKKNRQEFQALDMVMKTKDPFSGESTSQSNKCSELDRMVPAFLGVSKAILENVIFCHQEDSNWPLQEGSVLKKKFDDIFESSRYTKALEDIRNAKKNVAKNLKDANHKVELNRTHLSRFEQLQTELKKHNIQLNQLQEEITSKTTDIDAMVNERTDLEKKCSSVDKLKDKLRDLKSSVKASQTRLVQDIKGIDTEELKINENLSTDSVTNQEKNSVLSKLSHLQSCLDAGKKQIDSNDAELVQLGQRQKLVKDKLERSRNKIVLEKQRLAALQTEKKEIEKKIKSFAKTISNLAFHFSETQLLTQIQTLATQDNNTMGDADFSSRELREMAVEKAKEAFNFLIKEKEKVVGEKTNDIALYDKQIANVQKELADIEAKDNGQKEQKRKILDSQQRVTSELDSLNSSSMGGYIDTESIKSQLSVARKELEEHELRQSEIKDAEEEVKLLEEEEMVLNNELIKLSEGKKDLDKHQNKLTILTSKKKEFFVSLSKYINEKMSYYLTTALDLGVVAGTLNNFRDVETANFREFSEQMKNLLNSLVEEQELKVIEAEHERDGFNTAKNAVVSEKMKIEGQKSSIFASLEKSRKEAETLEDSLPRLSTFSANTFTTIEQAETAAITLRQKSDELREKYLETKVRSKILKRYGEVILKTGSCPVCSQTVLTEFANFFETDFNVPIKLNPDNQLHSSIVAAQRDAHFEQCSETSHAAKRRKEGVEGVSNKVGENQYNFTYKKNVQVSGVFAAAGNAFFESQRKVHELELLQSKYDAALEDLKEYEKHKLSFIQLAELRDKKIKTLEKEFLSLVEKEKAIKLQETEIDVKLSDASATMKTLKELHQIASTIKTEISVLANSASGVHHTQNELEKVVSKTSSSQNIEALYKNITLKEQKQRKLMEQTKTLRKKVTNYKDNLSSFSQTVIRLQSLYQANIKNDTRRAELLNKRQEFSLALTEMSKSLSLNEQKRLPLKRKQENIFQERQRKIAGYEGKLTTLQKKIRDFDVELVKLSDYHTQISKSTNLDIELEEVSEQIKSWQTKIDSFAEEISIGEKEESRRQRNSREQQQILKNIKYALKLRQEQSKYYGLVSEKVSISKRIEIAVGNLEEITSRLETVKDEVNVLRMNRERMLGQQTHLFESKDRCLELMKEKNLVNIKERYRFSTIDANTLKLAESDLNKYYKALDSALVKFHQIKIEEINDQIRELWNLTYKGGDIDRIAIKSDNDMATTRSSRSYNYRVVMSKGSTELDMRGRCSAGQKVLASLVIRMALGASFSADCGILALDEPTTNLDTDNKRSLAIALAEIIKERGDEASFQLIIITHDEEFVDLLKENMQSGGAAVFYNIKRDLNSAGKYISSINKQV